MPLFSPSIVCERFLGMPLFLPSIVCIRHPGMPLFRRASVMRTRLTSPIRGHSADLLTLSDWITMEEKAVALSIIQG